MTDGLISRRRLLQAGSAVPLAGLGRTADAQPPQRASIGRVERWPNFRSRFVDARHVEIWLPPGYDDPALAKESFGVLYMHDGQMLFDPTTTWNHQAWQIDVRAQAVMQDPKVERFIIVAPWNGGDNRHSEYFPTGFLPHLPDATRDKFIAQALRGRSRADDYLRFLVEELKPAVDARYRTHASRDSCALMGSSMGGLISLYALWEYPTVFSGAACLSTHWIGTFERNTEFPDAAIAYLQTKPPRPRSVRLRLDRGTRELDALYDEALPKVSAALTSLGFASPRFVTAVIEGAGHNEIDWGKRSPAALELLFSRESA